MKKYIFQLIALIAGATAAVAFTKPSHTPPVKSNGNHLITYAYFQFNGSSPQETSDKSKWEEITPAAYNDLTCDGTREGCKIKVDDTYTTGTPGSRTLTQDVPVTDDGTPSEAVYEDDLMTYGAFNQLP